MRLDQRFMTVKELLDELKHFPEQARVIVGGYEGGFDDATGAIAQPIVVGGGHRMRPGWGVDVYVPAQAGSGDHEAPDEIGELADELAALIHPPGSDDDRCEHRAGPAYHIHAEAMSRSFRKLCSEWERNAGAVAN